MRYLQKFLLILSFPFVSWGGDFDSPIAKHGISGDIRLGVVENYPRSGSWYKWTYNVTFTNPTGVPHTVNIDTGPATIPAEALAGGGLHQWAYEQGNFHGASFSVPAGSSVIRGVTFACKFATHNPPDSPAAHSRYYQMPATSTVPDPHAIDVASGAIRYTATMDGNPYTIDFQVGWAGTVDTTLAASHDVDPPGATLVTGMTVGTDGSGGAQNVTATFTISGISYNEEPHALTLTVAGQTTASIPIIGNAIGVPYEHTAVVNFPSNLLDQAAYEWGIGPNTVAGVTPALVYDEFLVPQDFAVIDSYSIEAGEFEPEESDPPENPEWTPPDNTGTGDPAGGPSGDPITADMTQADHYDATRTAVNDAVITQPTDLDLSVSIQDLVEEEVVLPDAAAALDGADNVLETLEDINEGLAGALNPPLPLPTVSGRLYVINAGTLPYLGNATLDISPWTAEIEILRNFILFMVCILATFRAVKIIRTSSADS